MRDPDVRAGGVQHRAWPRRRPSAPGEPYRRSRSALSRADLCVTEPDILRHSTPPRLKFWGVVALCVAGAVAVAGIGLRFYTSHQAANWTEDQAIPSVADCQAHRRCSGRRPRSCRATSSPSPMPRSMPRSPAMCRNWLVDIGTPVKAGQLSGPDRSTALSSGAGPGQGPTGERSSHAGRG